MEKEVVLVLTNARDETSTPVIDHLRAADQPFFRFNTECFPGEQNIFMGLSNGNLSRLLSSRDQGDKETLNLDAIKSVWWRRPNSSKQQEGVPSGHMEFIREESTATLWSLYTTLNDVFWMNHPLISSRLLEHNKLLQLKTAAKIGLRTPETIITNDAEEILVFAKKQPHSVAIKLLKGNFFAKEGERERLFVFTQNVSKEAIITHKKDLQLCPVMVQEYVSKKLELRVTIVGELVFTCAIHSQDSERTKGDWRRYDFDNVKHEPFTLPKIISDKLINLLRVWGLGFGTIDLILTPDDEYVFLEINPNGQWLWIEQLTGMPIAKAIAETLIEAPRNLTKNPW